MLISILAIVYDGNIKYLSDFLGSLRKKISIDYEVILWNNCEKEKLCAIDGVKIYSLGRNVGTYAARINSIKYTNEKSSYIWFVDIDDKIIRLKEQDIPENKNNDILSFDFIYDNKIHTDTNSYVWNKLFPAKIMRLINFPEKEGIIFGEDIAIVWKAERFCMVKEVKIPIYEHLRNGITEIATIDNFNILGNGVDALENLFDDDKWKDFMKLYRENIDEYFTEYINRLTKYGRILRR